jgi:lycopene cyclase CruA
MMLSNVYELRARFPLTVAAFEAMGALDQLTRAAALEAGWRRVEAGAFDPAVYAEAPAHDGQGPVRLDYDLIYAGGGLGLLHAAVMARRYGRRVLLFDKGQAGCAHREWNISRVELQALVDVGFASWEELRPVIMAEYRTGVVRFHNSPRNRVPPRALELPGVLDVALDAGALLALARRKLEEAGGTVLDYHALKRVRAPREGPLYVEVELEQTSDERRVTSDESQAEQPDGQIRKAMAADWAAEPRHSAFAARHSRYRARLLLDGMGSTSPLALLRHAGHPFAGVCPTVGTVATGFERGDAPQQHDPTLGDILLTVDDAQGEQQLMWEGFPGRGDELTVYLFYYDTVGQRRHSLLALFEQYFALLPSYKRPGPGFRHLKPVYGYIPARHSLRGQEAPLLRGVLPIGDAAAQQSPLTFCGFGSHVRNLARTTALLQAALRDNLTEPRSMGRIRPFQANVSLNWVFSRFMRPWGRPNGVNELQNVFLAVLDDLGGDLPRRFFQDRMRWGDYHKMILGTFRRYPRVVGIAWRVLGARGVAQWVGDYLRYSAAALDARVVGRAGGPRLERALVALAGILSPPLALRLRARYAEWRAMGWIEA